MTHDTDPAPFALVMGESLIDIVPDGAGTAEHPGGSPMNVAVGLARLGHPVTLATWFGPDPHGQAIRDHLTSSHVTVLAGSDGAAHTSRAQASFDEHGSARYVFDLSWHLPVLPDDAAPLVVHTGSIGATLRPGADDVLAAVRRLRGRATISFDPNIRPAIVGSPEAVLPLVDAFVANADIVKASDEDLAWLYPDTDPLVCAQSWLDAGPALVVLTRGAAGTVAFTRTEAMQIAAPDVAVADTVGAGDAFMAGLLHALWQGNLLGAARREQLAALDNATLTGLL
ncbi:MAG: carbohydrate kinase, partial [Propionibacteriaceae bacterium]|nr:carbohydrate kinase [Propionibacteriaceae bacterium]